VAVSVSSASVWPTHRRGPLARLHDALQAEREHWFIFLPVAFGVGIGAYFAWPTEPNAWALIAALALALLARIGSRGLLAILAGLAVVAAAGGVAAKLRTEWVRAAVLDKRIGPSEVKGYVALVEPLAKRGQRITLDVTSIAGVAAERMPRRVRIRAMTPLADLRPGDAIRVRASLAPPAGPALPAGYDFARTAWYLGLGGVGYSLTAPERDATAPPPSFAMRATAAIQGVRQAIGARVLAAIPGQTGAIANALITGERGGISEATNDAFRDAGLFHVLSISGLHMAIMAGTVFFAVRLLLACVPAIALQYPIKKWAALAAAIAALGYLLISGAAFATVRSYIMISIMFAAVLLDRPALAMRNVALAALVILVLYPESLLDVGFQMSFAAVVALIAAYEYVSASKGAAAWRRGWLGRVVLFFAGIVLSTIVAGVAVAPFAAYHFHTSQQFAVLANLITIPVCNLVVMPAALLALMLMPFGLEWLPLAVMAAGIDVMERCAKWTAELPGAVAHIRAIPLSAFLLMVAGGLWLTLWRTRWRTLGIAAIAAGLTLAPMLPRPDVLVGRDGALVAVRGDEGGGRYTALASRTANYELKRWLEHDGDPREPREVMVRKASAGGARCDGVACNVAVKQRTLAVVRHPSALRDDCARADILVLDIPRPRGCEAPVTVIDFPALRRLGTHALYFDSDDAVRIETVAQYRGNRPWSASPSLPNPQLAARPHGPAAPSPATPEPELRPETEGADDPRFEQE
jgi:competence protein ComEC